MGLAEMGRYMKVADSIESVHMLQIIMIKVLASFWLAIGEVCIYKSMQKKYFNLYKISKKKILQLKYHQWICFKLHTIWLIIRSLRDTYYPIIHCMVIVKCEQQNVLVMHYSTKSKHGPTFNQMLQIYRYREI